MSARLPASVGVLGIVVAVFIAAALPAHAGSQTLYLRGGGVPVALLSEAGPSSGSVKNFDLSRNADPGLTLQTTTDGWTEDASSRHQDFIFDVAGLHLSGSLTLTIWSALEDFANQDAGAIAAHLLDCNRFGRGCHLISETGISRQHWGGDSWVRDTMAFPAADHEFSDNRSLVLRITVPHSASHDLWIAYDSTITPATLLAGFSDPPTTTTTPTSTSSTPTPTPTPTVATTTTTTTTSTSSTTTTTTVVWSPTSHPGTADPSPPSTPDKALTGAPVFPTTTSTPKAGVADLTNGELSRSSLVTRGEPDSSTMAVERDVRSGISPTRHLSVAFAAITEVFKSSIMSALVLGVLGAALGLTVIDRTAFDTERPTTTPPARRSAWSVCQQCFPRLWRTLRSLRHS